LVDLHQIFYSILMTQLLRHKDVPLDESLYRHMVLNTLRANRVKFKDYNEVVIATDSKSWRKTAFPYYKANRNNERGSSSNFDWKEVFNSLNKIRCELKEFFPYKVLHVDGAEADDIIAWVCRWESLKQIMILSGDKDFVQLQVIPGVKQYDPVRKKLVTSNDPEAYLVEHILRGDSGDGVPNVLSDPDTFVVEGKRQVPLTKKKIKELTERIDKENIPGWSRNMELIDLTMTPEPVMMNIQKEYQAEEGKDRSKLFNYFIQNRLTNLLPNIQEF
jgi:5'-3' exonuclease